MSKAKAMSRISEILDPGPYNGMPGFKERTTSRDAAKAVSSRAKTLREKVLQAIKTRPMTADEVAAFIGEDILAIRPRVSELKKMGLITPTNTRRANKSGLMANVLTFKNPSV
jgi:predicted Rossmann fold nucleotide-binding protein DprA/Smf involved in DNA uptake